MGLVFERHVLEGFSYRLHRISSRHAHAAEGATNRFIELMGVYAAREEASEFGAIAHQTVKMKKQRCGK
jgi:hypothetical protein